MTAKDTKEEPTKAETKDIEAEETATEEPDAAYAEALKVREQREADEKAQLDAIGTATHPSDA